MNSTTPTQAAPVALGQSTALRTGAAALVAALLGALILYSVGFANSATLHNAAHDTRHGMTFPCH